MASVKHNIIGKLTDREFLLTNVIATSTNTTMKLNDDQILEIYELLKHQDSIGATLYIGSLNLRHSTNDIYKIRSEADILTNLKSIKASILIQKGTEIYDLKCENINLTPVGRFGEQLMPLIKAQSLTWQKFLVHPTSPLSNV